MADSIKLTQTRMSLYFNMNHRPVKLTDKVWLRLVRKPGKAGYRLPGASTLSVIQSGPYKIVNKISDLAYELKLPDTMKIHPIISVIHLEQFVNDPYNRVIPKPQPVLIDDEEKWIIEKIVCKT